MRMIRPASQIINTAGRSSKSKSMRCIDFECWDQAMMAFVFAHSKNTETVGIISFSRVLMMRISD